MIRRPLKSRGNPMIQAVARGLDRAGATPNQVSVCSVFFALAGLLACLQVADGPLISKTGRWWLAAVAVCIQLRLLCNVLDGLIAVEGGKKSPVGAIYNELPDRFADAFTLAGLGYAAGTVWWGIEAGWLACACALGVAYVRALGGALGLAQDFCGPMAKQHRMFAATVAAVAAALLPAAFGHRILAAALWIIVAGSLVTLFRRTARIAAGLRSKGPA